MNVTKVFLHPDVYVLSLSSGWPHACMIAAYLHLHIQIYIRVSLENRSAMKICTIMRT